MKMLRNTNEIPGIFVASLPKSGTVFLSDSLCRGLGKKPLGFPSGGLFPWATIPHEGVNTLIRNKSVYVIHCSPSRYNRIELSSRLDKMVVHVRDPRQALISFSHFLPALLERLDPEYGLHLGVPEDYLSRSYSSQLDWLCDHYFMYQVKWIEGWLDAMKDSEFKTNILFTCHEDLQRDQKTFFERILCFYSIPIEWFHLPPTPCKGHQNFRKGYTDEWKQALTETQALKISNMIPCQLYEYFKWERLEDETLIPAVGR